MIGDPEIEAIRMRSAYSRSTDVALLALRGDDAREALLHLLPSRLFLRDAQVKESLLLSEDGRPIADVLVCADDEDYLLLVEGMTGTDLVEHVSTHLPEGIRPDVEDLGQTHEVLSLAGPWAWQLAAATLGPDLVALPYLNFFRVPAGICVRAGKTGEYGYDIVVRREESEALWSTISDAATTVDALEVGPRALSLCRFENWFFDPAFVPAGVTPLELQLSWRLDMSRKWVGHEAIAGRMAEGVKRRLTCMVSNTPVAPGDTIRLDDREIGEVVRAAFSPARQEWVVAGLIDIAYAHGGIARYRVGETDAAVLTLGPPLIDNRSLYVDPRRHTWETRDEVEDRPLVRGPRALEAP